ncbi:MAG TPA: ATP-binding protein, partial [Bdellovibrionota bacterium]|nr:ATP-binding protein [Bdellovibrionota bacterium]
FSQVAAQKGVTFKVVLGSDAPATITSDEQRLQQILKNLLSNAFKFTDRGEVELSINRADGHPSVKRGKGVIAFTVSDSGIGIPPDKQQIIFDAFQQADTSTSRMYGGTGLGLTISRELARLLGGSIEVQSTPGVGSTFTLYLPQNYTGADLVQHDSSEERLPEIPALPESADFTGRRILVVDDDMRNIYAITSVLEARGMRVLYAENGRVGIKLLQEHPDVDLVLMDVMMPEMDGLEATREIRKEGRFAALPIISLTAKAMKGDREKAIQAGATDYVTKPVDPDRLLAVMHRYLESQASSAQGA